jgi:hypothetical protein
MQILLCYLLGIFLVLPIVWWATSKVGRTPEASLLCHALRIEIRCMVLAASFAPTAVAAGYVAFPVPALFILVGWLFSPNVNFADRAVQAQIRTSIFSLVVCFILFSVIYLAAFLSRYAKRFPLRAEQATGTSVKLACAGIWSIAIFIIALLALLCFLGPCSAPDRAVVGP